MQTEHYTKAGFVVTGIQKLPSGLYVGRVHFGYRHSVIMTFDSKGEAQDTIDSYDLDFKRKVEVTAHDHRLKM